jgi:oxygen-independent coproporphyrinogen-3 oxidase
MEQAEAAAEHLLARGFVRVGLDHFAVPEDPLYAALQQGDMHRNFQGYTDDPSDVLLGFGTSAIGTLPQGYVQNTLSITDYRGAMTSGRLATCTGVELDSEDRLRRDIIQTLMCDMRVDLSVLKARHQAEALPLESEFDRLQPLVSDGLLECENGVIQVTENGRPFVRSVCAAFDTYLGRGDARHSSAV